MLRELLDILGIDAVAHVAVSVLALVVLLMLDVCHPVDTNGRQISLTISKNSPACLVTICTHFYLSKIADWNYSKPQAVHNKRVERGGTATTRRMRGVTRARRS